jgi:hypothetical protein
MNDNASIMLAHYFSLLVEVISLPSWCGCESMHSSSLIRFRGREFIVDTADLVFGHKMEQAA